MVNEVDISQERKWFYEQRAKTVVKNLQKRNMNGQYVSTRQEVLTTVMGMIPPGAVVARGGSMTLHQVRILTELRNRQQNKLIDPWERDADGQLVADLEERQRRQREAFFADIFLTSTNAITLDGKLVSTDGVGNRVAAMIFGPKKVIVIAGINKIVKDVGEAMERIRQFTAPIHNWWVAVEQNQPERADVPCVKTGICVDCNHDWRPCCHTVVIEGAMIWQKGRVSVVLVGEDLGR